MKSSILASALVGTTVAQNVFAGRRGGFLPGNSFPMNVVGEMSGVEVSEDSLSAPISAFPMGSVQMPGSFSFVGGNQWAQGDFGAFDSFDSAESVLVGSTEGASAEGDLDLPSGGIGFNDRRERTEEVLDLISGHGPGPEAQWRKYVSSFKVLPGAQEPASQIINRQLSSLHNWASSFYGSRFVQENGRLGLGLERPRNFEYSNEPWVPPTPIRSCPAGTPDFVCERIAESISATVPRGESYNFDHSEYFLNQNLIRAGYGGVGAPNRRVPLGRNKITGPAPEIGPAASALNPQLLPKEEFNCVVEVDMAMPFNPPFRSADRISRTHELEIEYDLECVCTPQGLPQTDRCRMISGNSPDSLDTSAFPMAMGIYGDRSICTSFDDFQAGNIYGEVATPCETIVQMGVTVMPVTKLPGVQIPQPGYAGGYPGNRQSSYNCMVEVEVAMLMDSPMPWENNFESFEAFYIQSNELECQCDQYDNAIVSTCRMGMDNARNLEIGNDYGEYTKGGFYPTYDAESSGLLADGIDKYPYTQGSYNPNVVDQTVFPGWGTGVPSNPNFRPFRREGAEEETVERQSALTLADYKDFVAQAVEQATEAAQLANEAAVRAANAAEQGDANAAKAEARQAATYAAMADIAAEKAGRLSQQVNQKLKKAQKKNRKVQRKVEGTQ